MSIAYTVFRNAVQQRHLHPGRMIKVAPMRGRSLHLLASPARFKITDPECNRLTKSKIVGLLSNRNSAAVFILSRNESTGSNLQDSATLSTLSGTTDKLNFTDSDRLHTSTSESLSQTNNMSSASHNYNNIEATSTPVEPVLSSNSVQDTLVFESIPEPPTVPTPVDEVTGAILGEPTFTSLGLGGWSPSGIVQQCLECFHVNMGMPWWAAILTGTIIVRLLVFPLVVKSQRNAAKMQNNMPELQVLQMKMTEARQTGNALLAAKYGQDMMLFMKEKDISPFKSMMVPLAMAPLFVSFFFGLRKMANLPVESLKEGGLLWFVDLTLADPFYLLPLITSTTVWITLEIGADGMKLNSPQYGQIMKYVLRGIPIIMFPFTMNFPAAILCYWVSTNAISLVQVSILKIPAVREKLNIEKPRKISADLMPQNKKGFKESFKESWTNMRISREIEDRQRYDEISFKRAGKGPIPKTYKYDPTKAAKDVAAMQANRK